MNKEKLTKFLKVIMGISSIVGLLSIILEYGFLLKGEISIFLHDAVIFVFVLFIFYNIVLLVLTNKKKDFLLSHKFEFAFILLIIVEALLSVFDKSLLKNLGIALKFKDIAYLYIIVAQVFIVSGLILGGLRYNNKILQSKIDPSRLFVLSFLATILLGALLLMLPAATTSGSNNFIDALFTSTSAVCVTGLITVDTATYYTPFGQIIIMILFQVGGLGLMTFTTFFALFLSGGLGIKERIVLHDLLEEDNIGKITKIIGYLTLITFVIETVGAVTLFISIKDKVPNITEAIFISVFHSISAFCNAGFSLFSNNLMDVLVVKNYVFTTTIAFLIILGGIGFGTIMNVFNIESWQIRTKKIRTKFSLQTRIVVITTIVLIVVGTIATYTLEYDNTLKNMTTFEKIHASFFQSVTTRTAGYNTIDFTKISTATTIFYCILMFIGASPGGTGGGIKTTTFALIIFGSLAILRNAKSVTYKNRTIPKETLLRGLIKSFFSISIITLGILGLAITDDKSLRDISFEVFSAFGTVGLSRGITGSLSDAGKSILILMMFIGRVGPLAFLFAILKIKEAPSYDLPEENISIL
ncbi:MAG TPA: potassium transporter TrkG [Melioribacteraceae bacterium]|nr:potassium transporter TrkG [Melioribacteraceae bacterium]